MLALTDYVHQPRHFVRVAPNVESVPISPFYCQFPPLPDPLIKITRVNRRHRRRGDKPLDKRRLAPQVQNLHALDRTLGQIVYVVPKGFVVPSLESSQCGYHRIVVVLHFFEKAACCFHVPPTVVGGGHLAPHHYGDKIHSQVTNLVVAHANTP